MSNFFAISSGVFLLIVINGYNGYSFRGFNECRKKWESCYGLPRCCDTLQCYYKNGVGLRQVVGECVECVDRSLVCQRDAQCCDNLICQKDHSTDFNGICDILRSEGETCHEGNQCESGKCKESWFSGKCE